VDMDRRQLEAEFDHLWVALRAELLEDRPGEVGRGRPVRPGPVAAARRRVGALAALAVISIAVAGSAVAVADLRRPAHTGTFVTRSEAGDHDTGELLDMSAADLPQVARRISTDIPFPPGYGRWQEAAYEQAWLPGRPDHAGYSTTTLVRANVARQAICAWADSWVTAEADGDRTGRDRAARTIMAARHWPAVTTLDPRPDPRGVADNDTGNVVATPFGQLVRLEHALRRGDPGAVGRSLVDNGGTVCLPEQFRTIDMDRLMRESQAAYTRTLGGGGR
jgi:hypothetical protein